MIRYTYIVKCTEGSYNGVYYYGKHSTNDINDGYICSSKILGNYIKKHPKGFIRNILGYYNTLEELNEAEKKLIASAINDTKCANIASGGDGGNTGYWNDPNYRNTESYKSRCKKISIAAKQRWSSYSSEERQTICTHMSEGGKGREPWNKNKKDTYRHTKEWKNKQSERMTGHSVSEETCNKLKEAWINMDPIKRQERCEKIRLGNIGKKRTKATKQKMRDKHLGVPSPHKGKIGVSKGNIKTYIFENQLDDYIKQGFKKGFK